MTVRQKERADRLFVGNEPRWVRCYDSGPDEFDRYTAVFTGRTAVNRYPGGICEYPYLAMSEFPFHPQGFGQHGATKDGPCDVRKGSWGGPPIGRSNHLGKRIKFSDLPIDCKLCVLQDYASIWSIPLVFAKEKCGIAEWSVRSWTAVKAA